MELRRHIHVFSKFRTLIIAGAVLGAVLATLALARPQLDAGRPLAWRSAETFTSTSRLLITQRGFPEGRATFNEQPAGQAGGSAQASTDQQVFAPPDRLAGLATMYSYLLSSAQVRSLMPGPPAVDRIIASVITTGQTASALPLISLATTADSAAGAQQLNRDAYRALTRYLEAHQSRTHTPEGQRAQVDVLNPPTAGVSSGRSYTPALIAFLLTITAAVSLAYVLENLRPSWKAESGELEVLVEPWASVMGRTGPDDRRT